MRPSLESIMLRKSIGSMVDDRATCARCARTPLVGEFVHRHASGRFICGLCVEQLSEADREPLSSERMPAGERSLRVAPKSSARRAAGRSDASERSPTARAA